MLTAVGAVLVMPVGRVVMNVVPMLQELSRKSIRTDLQGKGLLRRGHEAHWHQSAERERHQQQADDPFAPFAVEPSLGHRVQDLFMPTTL